MARNTPNSNRSGNKLPALLLVAGLSAAALSGCDVPDKKTTTVSLAEQDSLAEARKGLAELNLSNSEVYKNFYDPTVSSRDRLRAIYDSLKLYIEFANENGVPTEVSGYDYLFDAAGICSIEQSEDGEHITLSASSTGTESGALTGGSSSLTFGADGVGVTYTYLSMNGEFVQGYVSPAEFGDTLWVAGIGPFEMAFESPNRSGCVLSASLLNDLVDRVAMPN